jgi:integrase
MSRRTGQGGSIEVRNGAYRGRYLIDVPGQVARLKRSVVIGFTKDMTKSEARRRLKEIIGVEGLNSPSYKIPSALAFAQHVKQWEQSYVVRMKPSTQAAIRYHIDTYLLPRWGKTAVDFITAEKVNAWIGELGHLARETVRGIIATLQRALGVKFGKGNIHYPANVKATGDTRCYTAGEITAILSGSTGQYGALFTLAAETGMRAGELYGLQVEDIEFSRNVIHVRRSSWNGQLQSPKTQNARRAIDVQPYVTKMLRQHLAGRTSGLVFLSRRKTALRNTTVLHKHLHPLLHKMNLEIGGMHAFRHFRVSFLVQNDTPVEIIKRWIGHGSEQMIRRYTHLHPTYFKGVMARIPTVFAPLPQQSAACVVQ